MSESNDPTKEPIFGKRMHGIRFIVDEKVSTGEEFDLFCKRFSQFLETKHHGLFVFTMDTEGFLCASPEPDAAPNQAVVDPEQQLRPYDILMDARQFLMHDLRVEGLPIFEIPGNMPEKNIQAEIGRMRLLYVPTLDTFARYFGGYVPWISDWNDSITLQAKQDLQKKFTDDHWANEMKKFNDWFTKYWKLPDGQRSIWMHVARYEQIRKDVKKKNVDRELWPKLIRDEMKKWAKP